MTIRSKCVIVFFALIMCLCASPVMSADIAQQVVKTRLDNGLTVLMLERGFSPTVSLYIRFRVGAVDENPGETGAAHFLEHMMFKGTPTIGTTNYDAETGLLSDIEKTGLALDLEKRKGEKADGALIERLGSELRRLQKEHRQYYLPNEIDRLYTQNGGTQMNASTGQDVTSYHVSLPANQIELWARIESDRLMNPVFREFFTERDVILEERRQRIDTSPWGTLYQEFMKTAYRVHPYGWPIIGLVDDMASMTPDAIRRIHKTYLNPENIVIAVVGDIDPDHTLQLIRKYFGPIPKAKAKSPEAIPEEPPQAAERRARVTYDANPMMMIGYHKPAPPSMDDDALTVLETILSRGRTSRLYAALVSELQIADSVDVYNGMPAARFPNLFFISASPRHPHTTDELEAAILEQIDRVRSKPVTESELARAKKQIQMQYIQSLEANSRLASILSYYELLLGDYGYFANYVSRIDQITSDDVHRVAKTYLTAQNRTIAILDRKKDKDDKPEKTNP